MKMVNLKIPKKNKEEPMPTVAKEYEKWPYGLKLRFCSEEVDKIPYLEEVNVGDKLKIEGIGEVVEVSSMEHHDGDKSYTVEVQLHEVGCEPVGGEKHESMGDAMRKHQSEYTG